MREIRTFEMGYDEPAAVWRVEQPLIVEVAHGTLWLTLEGDAEDYWLDPGQSFLLPVGAKAWIGSGRGDVRLTVRGAGARNPAYESAALLRPSIEPSHGRSARMSTPRWRQAAA